VALYGDVTFTLSGRAYTVRFGNLAWDAIYKALGVADPAAVIARILAGDKDARDVVLREGLATYHPEITTEEARTIYDQIPVEGERSLWSATWEALSIALPKLAAALEAAIRGELVLPPTRDLTPKPTPSPQTKRSAKRR
jgi:hypothetical protein